MRNDLKARTFAFGLKIIDATNHLPDNRPGRILGNQLFRSGTSVGANIEEASAGFTRRDFAYKMNLALKETRETRYWLRLISAQNLLCPEISAGSVSESEELMKALGSIVSKVRNKSKRKNQK
jgi:four helix bundle protein